MFFQIQKICGISCYSLHCSITMSSDIMIRIRRNKKTILLITVTSLLFVVFLSRPASNDVTVSWQTCVQHANRLLEEERESVQTNIKEEIESRVEEALRERKETPEKEIKMPTKKEEHVKKMTNIGKTSNDHILKPYSGEIVNVLRRSNGAASHSTSTSNNPLSEDQYVRNCITGQPLLKINRNIPLDTMTLMTEDSDEEDPMERKMSFEQIYHEKQWGSEWDATKMREQSVSGRGSSLRWSQEMSATLHTLISMLKSKLNKTRISLLDLPCGDMTWMERFLLTRDDIDYTGVDIVPNLINRHMKRYEPMPWRFLTFDIVNSSLPRAYDVILNRMLLQHLFLPDAIKALVHFSDSGSKYLLTTTFPREPRNVELMINKNNPGRFRPLNLEVPPVSLSPPLCLQRDGVKDELEGWDHFIGLWKLPLQQDLGCRRSKQGLYPGTDFDIYSCGEIHNI